MADAQKAAHDADLAFRQKVYGDEYGFNHPLKEMLSNYVLGKGNDGFAPLKQQIEESYAMADRETAKRLAASGFGGGSGLAASVNQGGALAKAKALSSALINRKMNQRQVALALLGRDGTQAAANGVGRAMENMAGFYGQQSAMLNNRAAGLGQAAGGALGAGMEAWLRSQKNGPNSNGPDYYSDGKGGRFSAEDLNAWQAPDSSSEGFAPSSAADSWGGGTDYSSDFDTGYTPDY
jgi:hypothetical protein